MAGVVSPEYQDAPTQPRLELDEAQVVDKFPAYPRASQLVPLQSRHALTSLMSDPQILPGPAGSSVSMASVVAQSSETDEVPEPVGPAVVLTGFMLIVLRRSGFLVKKRKKQAA